MSVLATTGVLVDHEPARERLATVGLAADPASQWVTFPRPLIEDALASAPSSIELFDRDGESFTRLEGDRATAAGIGRPPEADGRYRRLHLRGTTGWRGTFVW